MARAAADNLGTHTMEKQFTVTDPTGAVTSTPWKAEWECLSFEFRLDLECAKPGDTFTDDEGNVWERIA